MKKDPLEYDFIVALTTNGLHLRYDASLQRLKSVECYDPTKVKLVYQSSDVRYFFFFWSRFKLVLHEFLLFFFSSNKTIPTFLLIYKSFGPTYPGEFDSNQSIYTLKYPVNIPIRLSIDARDSYSS
jgi:hypothetical protein